MKQCSICGFADNQYDMEQEENGDWVHHECLQDALDGERHREEPERVRFEDGTDGNKSNQDDLPF